jgi:hypothetical protein
MIIFFLIFFSLLLNNFFIIFNEDFLLALSLVIFFYLIYILLNDSIKIFNFFKAIKLYYTFILLFKINIYINLIYKTISKINFKYLFNNKIKLNFFYININYNTSTNIIRSGQLIISIKNFKSIRIFKYFLSIFIGYMKHYIYVSKNVIKNDIIFFY